MTRERATEIIPWVADIRLAPVIDRHSVTSSLAGTFGIVRLDAWPEPGIHEQLTFSSTSQRVRRAWKADLSTLKVTVDGPASPRPAGATLAESLGSFQTTSSSKQRTGTGKTGRSTLHGDWTF